MAAKTTRWTPEAIKELRRHSEEGRSADEAAKLLGVTRASVSMAASRNGISFGLKPVGAAHTVNDETIRKLLKAGRKWSVEELSDRCDCLPKDVRATIAKLKDEGMAIQLADGWAWVGAPPIGQSSHAPESIDDLDHLYGPCIRFGLVSDNHLCSKYSREDVLHALYDVFEREGIATVYNCGNWIDGEARFNKSDLLVHTMGGQFRYFAERYPRRAGIDTYCIGGDDHEGWYVQNLGMDLRATFDFATGKEGRNDLHYLGYMEHDVVVPARDGETRIRLLHAGGGSAYAISYTTQKLIESLTGGEKPQIMCIGHYHKAEYIFYRNIHAVQAGTTQDQSPFMRKKRLAAHLGGWIIEAWQAPDGSIARFRSEWIPFFDRDYYHRWSYQGAYGGE